MVQSRDRDRGRCVRCDPRHLVRRTAHRIETVAAGAVRVAYIGALAGPGGELFAETRGVGDVAVWFTRAPDEAGECGEYPPKLVREHLAELGFLRVVVAVPNGSGGLCSFKP